MWTTTRKLQPVNPEELLKVIEKKLREKKEAEKITEEKIVKWIETRAAKVGKEEKNYESKK